MSTRPGWRTSATTAASRPSSSPTRRPKKKTYPQVWPAYNKAQTTEKRRLQVLLSDLCRNVPHASQPGSTAAAHPDGRCGVRNGLQGLHLYAHAAVRLRPGRRAAKGHVSQVAHFIHSIIRHFYNPDMTPILRDLVIRSSLPLKAVEVDFAPDSTGFSTNRFVKWYDEKYGVQRSGHDWVKVHIMTGVKTNIVTAVEIRGRDAADSPLLPPMLATTAKNFTIHEVSADKGYSGVDNTEAVFQAGGTPFIAYKANTTGAAGGLWEKMFHFFQYRREEFLTHYHKRSNVESTFSMMKAKFRDGVRARPTWRW